MTDAPEAPRRRDVPWGTRERAIQWVHMLASAALLAFVLIGGNLLARAHFFRTDWSTERSYELHDSTVKALRALDKDVTIHLFLPSAQDVAYDKSLAGVWQKIQFLCTEFQKRSPRIRVSAVTDPAALENLRHHFKAPVANSIYFVADWGRERYGLKAVAVTPGVFYEGNPNSGKVESFNGERWMLAGIIAASVERKRVAYSVIGHREATVTQDPGGQSLNWLAKFLAEREGIELRPLPLREVERIPDDCEALLVAGPRAPLDARECDILREYLRRGGRLFVALHPKMDSGLEQFLQDFGVQVRNSGWVCDNYENLGSRGFLRVQRFEPHEINRGMQNLNSTFTVPLTSVVERVEHVSPRLVCLPLFRSGPNAWEELGAMDQQPPVKDEGEEKGEMFLGMAVSGQLVEEGSANARLVVWGSVHALCDLNLVNAESVVFENLEYILNHFRWLMGREDTIAIPEKRPGQRPMDLSPTALNRIKWVTLAGFPSLGILVGILAWFLRRK